MISTNKDRETMKEIFAELREVRPGRKLFVREWTLGIQANDENNDAVPKDLQLVCIHGSCATEAQFHSLLRALDYLLLYGPTKLRIKCILFDMVGCGQSPMIEDWDAYSGQELQRDLGSILETFSDASLPIHFVSHSYGPNILVHLLNSDHNKIVMDKVKGFIFLGAAVRVNSSHPVPDGGHPVFRLPVWMLEMLQSTLTKEFLSRAIDPSNPELHDQCLKSNDSNAMFMVKAFYRQTKWATSDELIQAINNKPVIHFHGVNDGVLQIEWGQHLVNQLAPTTTEFVPMEKASHLIMMEKPAEIARKVCDFLVSNHALGPK